MTPFRPKGVCTIEPITTARFFRKPIHVRDLQDDTPIIKAAPFQVTKVEELTRQQFQYFCEHLLDDALFLTRDRDLMGYDTHTGAFRCVFVTCPERPDGILVDSEGYDYARYAAHIPDKGCLDLRDIPVQHYEIPGTPSKQRRGHRER